MVIFSLLQQMAHKQSTENYSAEYDTDLLKRISSCTTVKVSKAYQSNSPPIRRTPYQRYPRIKLPMNFPSVTKSPLPMNFPSVTKSPLTMNFPPITKSPSPMNCPPIIKSPLPMNSPPITKSPLPMNSHPISKTSYQHNHRIPSPLNIAHGIASQENFQELKRIDFNALSLTTSEARNIKETLDTIFPELQNQYNALSLTTSEARNIKEALDKIFPELQNQYKTSNLLNSGNSVFSRNLEFRYVDQVSAWGEISTSKNDI